MLNKVFFTIKLVKNLPAIQETWVWSLGQEGPLEKEMATHSSILAWRIPWTEELGGLQSMGSQVRHDLATKPTKNQPTILTKFRIFLFFFFFFCFCFCLTIVRGSPVDLTPKRFWAKLLIQRDHLSLWSWLILCLEPFIKDFSWVFKDGVFGAPQRINKWDFIPNDRSGYKKIAAYYLWKTVKWQNRLYHLSCVLPQIKLFFFFNYKHQCRGRGILRSFEKWQVGRLFNP